MPIKPENKKRYPDNWQEIRERILKRADNKCEICGIENHKLNLRTGKRVVLTIMHLDHIPEHCDDDNLKAACQSCHNNYDIEHRIKTRRMTRTSGDEKAQLKLFDE